VQVFKDSLLDLGMTSEKAFPGGLTKHITVDVRHYDSFGESIKSIERVNSKYLISIRM